MACRSTTSTTTLALLATIGAAVALTAGRAEAATPTYYNSLPAFQADVTNTVTDDYSNPGYVFIQNNAVMSAVIGQTDYMSTGFNNLNIVSGGYYCAGCNGSFELSFQTTTVGTAAGVNGVGVYLQVHSLAVPYYAYITFADGTTANIALPAAGNFWGVAAPERVERIHFGLSNGATTTNGSFGIDNLIIGDGNIGGCVVDGDCVDDMDPCTNQVCNAGLCTYPFNAAPCDDGEVCTENDVCAVGTCQGSLVDCNDGNACTTDFCDFGNGCAIVLNNDPCDDGDACTELDACAAGSCSGSAIDCNDDDVCTVDSCDPMAGCMSEPTAGCCVGDEDCGADEVCEGNVCVPVPAGSSSGGGGGESSGPADTGTPGETGVDGTGDGESGVVTGAGDSDGGTTSGGSTGGDTGLGFDDGTVPMPGLEGCACTTDSSPQRRLWWLMVVVGVLVRRRRAA
jgi:MYXO-CTERM domain-containing protein